MNAVRNFLRTVWLGLIRLFWPGRLAGKKAEHNERLNSPGGSEQEEPRDVVRRVFFRSFSIFLFWVVPSGVVGCVLGRLLGHVLGCSTPTITMWLLIVGVTLAYLARSIHTGWEIQPPAGRTKWMYRALLVAGTVIVFSSLTWPQCSNIFAQLLQSDFGDGAFR